MALRQRGGRVYTMPMEAVDTAMEYFLVWGESGGSTLSHICWLLARFSGVWV